MRKLGMLVLVLVLVACGSPSPSTSSSSSSSSSSSPSSSPSPSTSSSISPSPSLSTSPSPSPSPSLSPWPSPSLTRIAQRVSSTDHLSVSVEPLEPGAQVQVAVVRGPTPADCDRAHTIAAGEGGTYAIDLDPMASATVCVRDADGRVRATATSPGFRGVPGAQAVWRGGSVMIESEIEPIDDDVREIVIVSGTRPSDDGEPLDGPPEPPLACATTAAGGTDDDPPEVCTYDCSGAPVALAISRTAWDAVMASPSYRARDDHGEMLYPPSIGVAIPITLPEGHDAIRVCVRTAAGLVTDDPFWRQVAIEPWAGCDVDTIAGCASDPYVDLERGDVVLGLDAQGAVVRAPIRTLRRRYTEGGYLFTTRGSVFVAADARLRADDGSDVSARDVVIGTRLWTRYGTAVVTGREGREPAGNHRPFLDLAGADYVLVGGFAVRDEGRAPEATTAPRHVDTGLVLDQGNGDCALAAEWAAATSHGHAITLGIEPVAGHDTHASRRAVCDGTTQRTIDASVLDAIASMAPDARIRVQIFGDAIECTAPYAVSRCDAGAPIGEAVSWTSAPQCLPEGTPIDAPNGRIAIEKLERGDEVVTYDATRGLGIARVLGSTTHAGRATTSVTLDEGTVLVATPDHVVMAGTPPRETPISDLAVGDVLSLPRDGALVPARVVSLAPAGTATVVELRVTAPDTYFANGVLVHNY